VSSSVPAKPTVTRIFHKRIVILAVVIIGMAGSLVIFYAWDYRPQTLADVTVSIKEQYSQPFNVDLVFGDRNVEVVVQTSNLPVYATLWWQSGTNALIYIKSQPVSVNSTWTSSVTLHNSGGQYFFLVAKNEAYGEGLTTIHVRIAV
jgi:hypothetical protein